MGRRAECMTDEQARDDRVTRLVHAGWAHLRLERPLAAWSSFRQACALEPESRAALQALEILERSRELPAAALAVPRLRELGTQARAQAAVDLGDLEQATGYYASLCERFPADPACWFNRAVLLAWQGENALAVRSLERSVALDSAHEPERAQEAWILAAVLRQGAGAEELADDLQYSFSIPWKPDLTERLLETFPQIKAADLPHSAEAAVGERADVRACIWLESIPDESAAAAGIARDQLATVFLGGGALRLSSPARERLELAEEMLVERLELDCERASREARPLPLAFLDAAVWMFRIEGEIEPDQAAILRRERIEHYFEDQWIHVPRVSLSGATPLEAAARDDAFTRIRLAAAIRFREQLAARPAAAGLYEGYPFDRLRRRLGLPVLDPDQVDPLDLACASGAELDALDLAGLDAPRLVEAVASAAGLRDDRRTERMARALFERLRARDSSEGTLIINVHHAVAPGIRRALAEESIERALDVVEQARPFVSAADADTLALWRAQILARGR